MHLSRVHAVSGGADKLLPWQIAVRTKHFIKVDIIFFMTHSEFDIKVLQAYL